ncbi:hypothetical protein MWG07_10080 [Fusobacterium necrophorum]|uniref:Uncharacterized protein n=1 Tax=Fusobacterium necrophorum TaxID=859 RepID=A0AAW6WDC1_9FUSO|nr:hypothetical protein [Fusobacterium necrophorum]MDK4481539.1 hypothetical protein [Fusobacterium necrophorum]MDK4512598.1 hypothetical protein [Fusobacterium necrophorum]
MLETLAGTAISKIIDVIASRVPMTKDQKDQLQLDLAKVELETLKEKGTFINTITKAIPLGIPLMIYMLLGMYALNYLSDFIHAQFSHELPIIPIPKELVEFCKTIVMFLFGSKTISRFSPDYVNAKYNKEDK